MDGVMKSKSSPELAKLVIEELGAAKVQKETDVTFPTISNWKRRGLPFWIEQHFRKEYPCLYAWKKTNK